MSPQPSRESDDVAPFPAWLGDYLAIRDRERSERRDEAWAKLSEAEQRLCREFAVMGYVRGHLLAGGRDIVPPDQVIMAEVLDGLLSDAGQSMRHFRRLIGLYTDEAEANA